MTTGRFAPTLAEIEALAHAAVKTLPDIFKSHLSDVRIVVDDWPAEDVCEEMELETPYDILGLYAGHTTGRSVEVSGALPDTVYLYRRPLIDYWAEHEETLEHLVAHVLIHEVGHHFGLSDEDMHGIEDSID